jgi:hypothetical protein
VKTRQSLDPARDSLTPEVVALARKVVSDHYPRENGLFGLVLAEFETDARVMTRRKPINAPVGAGLDLGLVVPYVIAAASLVGGSVAKKVADKAVDGFLRVAKSAWTRVARKPRDGQVAKDLGSQSSDELKLTVQRYLERLGAPPEVAEEVAAHVVDELSNRDDIH